MLVFEYVSLQIDGIAVDAIAAAALFEAFEQNDDVVAVAVVPTVVTDDDLDSRPMMMMRKMMRSSWQVRLSY